MNCTNPNFVLKHHILYTENKTSNQVLTVKINTPKLNTKTLSSLRKSYSVKLSTFLTSTVKLNYSYLTYNLFNSFFTNSSVEVPKVLLNLKSLVNPDNQITLFKFNNHLMLHGNFIKSLVMLNVAWYNAYCSSIKKNDIHWSTLYFTLPTDPINSISVLDTKDRNTTSIKSLISRFYKNHQPIFNLYIYKISKNIYKNTRGKSGKFIFSLKYVPVYKRFSVVTSWLIKELRVLPERGIIDRLTHLLLKLLHTPLKTWVSRVKTFSYNYIYRNCKRTLAVNYKSVKA